MGEYMKEGEVRHLNSTWEFFRMFFVTSRTMMGLRRIDKKDRLSPALMEKVMLAVTGVNRCRYCSYRHSRTALEEGVDPGEIALLLSGDRGTLTGGEAIAVSYAQHWADTAGGISVEARDRVLKHFGREGTRYIEAHIRSVYFGNMVSNTVYAYRSGSMGRKEKRKLFITYLLSYPIAMMIKNR